MSDVASEENITGAPASYSSAPEAPVAEPEPETPDFDIVGVENPSFAVLDAARCNVFATWRKVEAFRKTVEALPQSGEEGRRRGLGLWILGDLEACDKALAAYPDDPVAAFTRGKALTALERFDEAHAIFQKLADSYPDEPRPRGCALEANFEKALREKQEDASEQLTAALDAAPASFAESADAYYLRGLAAEHIRDWESALDAYEKSRELDGSRRETLFRLGYVAERGGLDDLALDAYETLAALKPIDRHTLLNLGVLYEDLGRDQDAAALYDMVTRSFPTDERAALYLKDARAGMNMYYDEDMERKEDRLNQILRIPITDFELSVRARNCLNKMQITTLGDLVCRTEQELLSYKNFGETSLNEIKEILHSKGLRLGMPRDEAVASIEAHSRRPQGDSSDLLSTPITELQLSIRARRTVEALGCLTVGEVTKHSAEELLGMPNFGITSLQELKSKLTELGLKLRGE